MAFNRAISRSCPRTELFSKHTGGTQRLREKCSLAHDMLRSLRRQGQTGKAHTFSASFWRRRELSLDIDFDGSNYRVSAPCYCRQKGQGNKIMRNCMLSTPQKKNNHRKTEPVEIDAEIRWQNPTANPNLVHLLVRASMLNSCHAEKGSISQMVFKSLAHRNGRVWETSERNGPAGICRCCCLSCSCCRRTVWPFTVVS